MSLEIILVAAIAENYAIGKNNDLLWHLPDDLKHFVALTKGNAVLMGRKTYDSLFIKPLPKRKNLIVSRDKNLDYKHLDVFVFDDLQKALKSKVSQNQKLFVIGGGEIYKQTINLAHSLEITFVHTTLEADTFFPAIDPEIWEITEESYHPADEKHKFAFTFRSYRRRNLYK